MPKRDVEYMAERRRDILDATSRCLDRLGLSATSTTEICREAGISMGALYTHFKSKDEIFLAVAERSADRMGANLVIATIGALRTLLLRRLRSLYRPSEAASLRIEVQLLAEGATSPGVAREMLGNYRISRRMTHGALQHLAQAGDLAPGVEAETATTLLENFHYGLLMRRAAGCAETREMAELALDRLLQTTFRDMGSTEQAEAPEVSF